MFKTRLITQIPGGIYLFLILCLPTFAQDYTIEQATFLEAKTAKIYPLQDKVQIKVTELSSEVSSGATLTIKVPLADKEIEVTALIDFNGLQVGLYPPAYLQPADDDTYAILGKAGQRFGIRARTETGVKQIYLILDGTPTNPDPDPEPDPDPSPDYAEVSTLVQKAMTDLNDPVTAKYVAASLQKLVGGVVTNDLLKKAIGDGLQASMREVAPPYKDWENQFRKPLNELLLKLKPPTLEPVVVAILKGMTTTSNQSRNGTQRDPLHRNGTVKMFTRPNCTICAKWVNEVFPTLAKSGWTLETIYSDGVVPQFVICNHNKCSPVVTGYLTVDRFNQENSLLR